MIEGQTTSGGNFTSGNVVNAISYAASAFTQGQLISSGFAFAGSGYQNYLAEVQIFGVSAYQDTNIIIIQKSDLVGLTASTNNRAVTLLAAILVRIVRVWSLTFMAKNFSIFHWKSEFIANRLKHSFVVERLTEEE